MAPRGRPRKGNTRMDAALDFMGPMGMGFPIHSIRQTVKELLKVYGGDNGWPFIEENCYSVLLDALVEHQQTDSPKKDVLQDDTRGSKDIEPSTAGSPCAVTAPNCSELETQNSKLLTDAALNSITRSNSALEYDSHTKEEGARDYNSPPTNEVDTRVLKDTEAGVLKETEPSPASVSSCGVTRPNCSDLGAVNSKLLTDATLNSITQSIGAFDFQAVTDEAGAKGYNSSPTNTRGSKDTEASPTVSSCGVIRPKCADLETLNSKLLTDATLNSITQITKALDFQAVTNEAGPNDYNSPPSKEERTGDSKDGELDMISTTKNVDDIQDFGTDKQHIECVKDWEKDKCLANTPFYTPKMEGFLSSEIHTSKKRRPYHGWISADDNTDELVYLTPIAFPEGLEKLFKQFHGAKKCKTRWDVRPEDV